MILSDSRQYSQPFERYRSYFDKATFSSFVANIQSQITSSHQEQKTRAILTTKSQPTLNRLYTTGKWNYADLNRIRVHNLQQDKRTRITNTGILIVDSSLFPFYRSVAGSGMYFDDKVSALIRSRKVEFLYYQKNDHIGYPVDAIPYVSKREEAVCPKEVYRSVVDIVIHQLKKVAEHTDAKPLVVADGWYSNAPFMNGVRSVGFHYLTRLKKNRNIVIDGIKYKMTSYMADKDTAIVALNGVDHLVNIVRIVDDGNTFYLASDDLTLSPQDMQSKYLMRWCIETFFENAKLNLDINGKGARSMNSFMRHIHIALVAYTHLMRIQLRNPTKTIGMCCLLFLNRFWRALLNIIHTIYLQYSPHHAILYLRRLPILFIKV